MIRKLILPLWFLFFGVIFLPDGFTQNPYFISDPTVSPDGESIVFVYENDLWRVPASGGTAYRLTSLEGKVSVPRFSPDGQWLAFTSTRDNNANVYVLPASGGEIKQLTWHQSDDRVDSWSWDSRFIYFHSSRENMSSVFKVSLDATTPQRLFPAYFNLEHHLVEHPQTGAYIFTESWESLRFPQRKRYRGEHNPDILSYNAANDQFFSITSYEGKDMWPTIDRSGNIYYVSDEFNGEYNLYVYSQDEIRQLTVFDHSIGRPQVSADGRIVAFTKGYQLHVYDVAAGETKRIEMNLFQSPITDLEQSFDVKGKISSFDVSPDTKKIAFISRGELFVSDAEGKFVRKLSIHPLERALEVKWLADNKTLLYTRTQDGWANLFTINADGNGAEKQLENRQQTTRNLSLNAERTSAVYLSGRDELRILDLSDFTSQLLVKDEMWGLYNPVPYFSPDGKHVVFTVIRAFEQEIMVHHLESGETINLTRSGVSQRQPSWSPDGKYIYFVSDRVTPSYPRSNTQNNIYRIPLYRFQKPMRKDAFNELFAENEENDTLPPVVRFDLTDLQNRWEEIRVNGGVQWSPLVFEHKNGQYLFFVSNHEAGKMALYKREFAPFEEDKTDKIEGPNPGSDPQIVNIKDKFWILAAGNIHELKPSANKMEAIDIRYSFSRNLANEFTQVFYETWTTLEENFYDDDFHGVDWQETLDYYATFLPHLRNRENLRALLNDMLGELNASHMGFSSSGEEEEPFFKRETAETGIIFSNANPYKVDRIITASHLDITDETVLPGDLLVAVNGRDIDEANSRDEYFYFAERPDELTLTFQRDETRFDVNMLSHSPADISNLLYDEWIKENRIYVEENSGNRIAYVYMKNMGAESLEQFLIDMTTYGYKKDALLFDIRFNRGGNVHDDVLQFLSQKPYLKWKYRGGALAPQPNFAPAAKPMVLTINERSLSDAEMTAEGFRQLGLGQIIGVETYRWIIFTSGKSFVDGSFCRLPSWGCYTLDGGNLEMQGVAPDLEVRESFHDRLHNRRPQLDRAIEELLKQL
jgi:tricorn protease